MNNSPFIEPKIYDIESYLEESTLINPEQTGVTEENHGWSADSFETLEGVGLGSFDGDLEVLETDEPDASEFENDLDVANDLEFEGDLIFESDVQYFLPAETSAREECSDYEVWLEGEDSYAEENKVSFDQDRSPFAGYDEVPEYQLGIEESPEFDPEPEIQHESARSMRRAISRNKVWAKRLNWGLQLGRIKKYLMMTALLINPEGKTTLDQADSFVRAVAKWQKMHGDKRPDGIIGPKTWAKLEPAIGVIYPPPISPGDAFQSGFELSDLSAGESAKYIYESVILSLNAWDSALRDFGVVLNSVSDSEGTIKFAGVFQSYIKDQLVSTLVKQSFLVSQAKGLIDAIENESDRASAARDAATLRDFMVKISRNISQLKVQRTRDRQIFIASVEKIHKGMSSTAAADYKRQLANQAKEWDIKLENGWLSGKSLFRKIAFAWIRHTKKEFMRSTAKESLVWMKIDKNNNIRTVLINAPGGNKIGEQLIKDAEGGGIRPYLWPVPRIIAFYRNSSFVHSVIRFDSNGKEVYQGRGLPVAVARRRFRRLKVLRPMATTVK